MMFDGGFVASSIASVMMNGMCCAWNAHQEEDRRLALRKDLREELARCYSTGPSSSAAAVGRSQGHVVNSFNISSSVNDGSRSGNNAQLLGGHDDDQENWHRSVVEDRRCKLGLCKKKAVADASAAGSSRRGTSSGRSRDDASDECPVLPERSRGAVAESWAAHSRSSGSSSSIPVNHASKFDRPLADVLAPPRAVESECQSLVDVSLE